MRTVSDSRNGPASAITSNSSIGGCRVDRPCHRGRKSKGMCVCVGLHAGPRRWGGAAPSKSRPARRALRLRADLVDRRCDSTRSGRSYRDYRLRRAVTPRRIAASALALSTAFRSTTFPANVVQHVASRRGKRGHEKK
eukprot:7013556-Prymnesium_polylepis.1